MGAFNVFRILGDISHTASKVILIMAIHSNSSAEGVSLISQVLYAAVFCTRYLDIFTTPIWRDYVHFYLFFMKMLYILSSFYTIFLMTQVYARTREREKAWKFGLYCLLGSVLITPVWYWIVIGFHWGERELTEGPWVFSQILESVCVIPQLLLLRQTTVPTVLDSYYLVTLGTYRFMYILNWIYRLAHDRPPHVDPTSWTWGTIQTALIIDFIWVYYSRQRVKLRKGGVVDSDDLRQGWLIGRFAGRKSLDFDYDEEEARNEASQSNNQWGRRGMSVSADEGVLAQDSVRPPKRHGPQNSTPESQRLADPAAFEDESDDEPVPATATDTNHPARDEWNDDVDDDAREHSSIPK
ncbi:hypothetical protein M011DRAFT_213195 [Sporormia fimetaria CBS 119925]|uniref:ER lumen protein retaining receptor n=1 Tax=Sporormia fimetaria CBS 119925 TaxID=1340428 RepID=A0A6A6V3P1_9PLEO|nr:hypothetical protein M011DRAFT_213195 [Sporormia fimetaria CBS 119925]